MRPISKEEAQESLADINRVAHQMQQAVAGSPMGNSLLIGGVIWAIGFTLSYVFPTWIYRIWWLLSPVGLAGVGILQFLHHRKGQVRSEQSRRLLGQVSLFWTAVMAYSLLLCLLLPLSQGADLLVLVVSILMLGYVVMGLWMKTSVLCLIGLVATVIMVIGRVWLSPRTFLLWMAVFGGASLLVPGLYIKLRWK